MKIDIYRGLKGHFLWGNMKALGGGSRGNLIPSSHPWPPLALEFCTGMNFCAIFQCAQKELISFLLKEGEKYVFPFILEINYINLKLCRRIFFTTNDYKNVHCSSKHKICVNYVCSFRIGYLEAVLEIYPDHNNYRCQRAGR